MRTRKATFAGSWYPATAAACEQEIQSFIKEIDTESPSPAAYVGGIVPHAGWYYSGRIACQVIQALHAEPPPDVFLIFGMHLHAGSSRYMMADGAWETPFGDLEIHTQLAEAINARFPFEIETARRFNPDNTIELQLPFIKYFFGDAKIVPMGVPPVSESLEIGIEAAEFCRDLGLSAKVIGSTDLTHYGVNYGFVSKGSGREAVDWVRNSNDRRIIEAMLDMAPQRVIDEALEQHNACCSGAAATTIAAVKALGARRAETLAYATSYDRSPGDSFVGYVGMVFS